MPAKEWSKSEAKDVGWLAVASEGGKMHSIRCSSTSTRKTQISRADLEGEALGSNGFCVGDQLTMADLSLFVMTCMVASGFFDGVPPPRRFAKKTVASLPEVMAWYDDDESYHAQSAPGKVCKACRDL